MNSHFPKLVGAALAGIASCRATAYADDPDASGGCPPGGESNGAQPSADARSWTQSGLGWLDGDSLFLVADSATPRIMFSKAGESAIRGSEI